MAKKIEEKIEEVESEKAQIACQPRKCCSSVTQMLKGFSLGAGIAAFGYFSYLGWTSCARMVKGPNSIQVKGLVSRRLKCDHAEWKITFCGTGNEVEELVQEAKERRERLLSFLAGKRISSKDIRMDSANTSVEDRHASFAKTKYNLEPPRHRYKVTWTVVVDTKEVDKVVEVMERFYEFTEQFPRDGNSQFQTRVYYTLDNLDVYRADMIAEAAASARKIAESLVAGNGGRLGHLLHADQGTIRYGRGGSSDPFRQAELVSYFKIEVLPGNRVSTERTR